MKATALSVVLLLNLNSPAQELPPFPGGGDTKPRDPTPEELKARARAHEAWLQKNLKRFQPYLIKTLDQLAGPSPAEGRFLSLDALLWKRLEEGPTAEKRQQAAEAAETKRRADAEELGLPLFIKGDGGGGVAFDGVDESGRPIFLASSSLNSAFTIQTDKIWPGGALGLELTGTNRTIAMWDTQHPYVSHPVFGSGPFARLSIQDSYSSPPDPTSTDHATEVAGVLGGAQGTGSPGSNSKGMAFGTSIHAYNSINHLDELSIAYTNFGNVRLTCHTYGKISGWHRLAVSNVVSWVWVGVTRLVSHCPVFGFCQTALSLSPTLRRGRWIAGDCRLTI